MNSTQAPQSPHLFEHFDHLKIIHIVAIDPSQEKLASSSRFVTFQASRPQFRVLSPAYNGRKSLTRWKSRLFGRVQCVLLDVILLVSRHRLRVAIRDSPPLIVEAAILCQQYADEKINGGGIIRVDGSSSVKRDDEHAANKVQQLSEP